MAELSAELRKETTKRATKALRQRLMVPAIVYGQGRDPLAVAVSEKELTTLVREHGHSALCTLNLLLNGEGPQQQLAIYRELKINPLTRRVEHVDFQAIRADEKVHLKVPVHSTGTPKGVDLHGGILILMSQELEIRCLPAQIPDFITVDVSGLDLHQNLFARDVKLPEGVELADDPSRIVANCTTAQQKLAAPAAPTEGAEAGAAAPAAAEPKAAAPAAGKAAAPAKAADKGAKK